MPESTHLIKEMQAAISYELESCIQNLMADSPRELIGMMKYQLGMGKDTGNSTGKRLRPLIVLATCHALGGNWKVAAQAAAAVELMHNFSLIHDDIQDQSYLRRGKDTLWVKWGTAQAINAGDAMLALSNLEASRDLPGVETGKKLHVSQILSDACFQLTHGQYLDLAYESADLIDPVDYFHMVSGKTGALLAASFALGGVIAGHEFADIENLKRLGMDIGIAFQIQDDWLGIWGEEEQTGKSVSSDLLERKKTYPVIKALDSIPEFRAYWNGQKELTIKDVAALKQMLSKSGLKESIQMEIDTLYQKGGQGLSECFLNDEGRKFMNLVLNNLWNRSG